MTRIRVLPESVANRIAAGEVIERPASVVKELVENALDAGASSIRVEVEGGGRHSVIVTDDGCGMSRDDALLAFERHATSKLRTADDLLAIATLGFRGEALPSIAAVSRLVLETRAAEENEGTRVEWAGGKLIAVRPAGLPVGTRVTVSDLFYCVPARRKFLKSDSVELGHIASLVTHYALAYPERHFELRTPTQQLIHAPAAASAAERVYQLFGRQMLEELIEIPEQSAPLAPPTDTEPTDSAATLTLRGFVSRPQVHRTNRNNIYTFVNRRLVRDRLMLHALMEAYRNLIPEGTFPVALLFLELPPEAVDVNVHPAKIEVRFRQPQRVHDFIRDALRTALAAGRAIATFPVTAEPRAPVAPPSTPAAVSGAPEPLHLTQPEAPPASLPFPPTTPIELPTATPASPFGAAAPPVPAKPDASTIATLRPLGQMNNSFIVAVNAEGLWLIDQHVAHERVLFERHLEARRRGSLAGQRLLMPLVLELQPRQLAIFDQVAEELRANGFDVEPIGPRSVAVRAAPAGVPGSEVEKLLLEILDEIEQEHRSVSLETVQAKIAASTACHAAIKANQPLDQQKMQWLLAELATAEHPMSCPHGRPVLLRYSLREIERAFGRS
jgi:DNA mismatch repair protein MutL